jgi:CHAT domain-containing protein
VRSLASSQTLEWLWDTIASPVLGVIGFTETPPSNKWPRIWWIPTGPLIQMPLHAAGYHRQEGSKAVLDRVLSSYGSSIRNIIRGRREAVQASIPDQALLVAMEHTLGHDSLSFAVKEIDSVKRIIESIKINPIIPERTKKYITQYLPECQIFHFAGHGLAHIDDPSQSCLLLEDWETDSLKVSDIFDMDFRKGAPFLAYLSACGTGQIKNETSFDENINLIGACQIAGFRHVIGTLWSVQDEMSVRMATMTYKELKDSDISDNSICRGLHKATCELRRDWLERRRSHQSVVSSTITDCHKITIELHGGSVRDASLIDCGDQNLGLAYWAPYVHYGV